MNKILPIILVVVLSGCATSVEERYADKPFIPDSARGDFSLIRIYQNVYKDSPNEQLTEGQRIGKSIDDKNKRLKALEYKVQCMENKKRMESMGMTVLHTCY